MQTDSAKTVIKGLLAKQRDFFDSGQTKDIAFRKKALEALYDILRGSEGKVLDALGHDLSKSDYEGYMTEFGIILEEIGSYHGKASFDTFSHLKSILKKPLGFDIPLRYPPFKNKLKLLKKLMH